MPGKERHEQAIKAFRPIFLLRADSPLGEVVLPRAQDGRPVRDAAGIARLLDAAALNKHPVGQETVNGIATTKYAVDESVPEGHATGTLWLSRDGIPMRLAGSFTRQQRQGLDGALGIEPCQDRAAARGIVRGAARGFPNCRRKRSRRCLGLKLKSSAH